MKVTFCLIMIFANFPVQAKSFKKQAKILMEKKRVIQAMKRKYEPTINIVS